jgi:hypothetical protein
MVEEMKEKDREEAELTKEKKELLALAGGVT